MLTAPVPRALELSRDTSKGIPVVPLSQAHGWFSQICSQSGRPRTSESREQQIPSFYSPSSPPERLWPRGPSFVPCNPST